MSFMGGFSAANMPTTSGQMKAVRYGAKRVLHFVPLRCSRSVGEVAKSKKPYLAVRSYTFLI